MNQRMKTKVPLTELRVGGGGSKSDTAVQIAADIFNLPAKRMRTFETCALGAAIDAAVGVGLFNDFESAVESMVHVGREFNPNRENSDIYNDLFNDVYPEGSKSDYNYLKDFFQGFNEQGCHFENKFDL